LVANSPKINFFLKGFKMQNRNFRPDPQNGYSLDEELAYLAQNGNNYNPPQEGEDGDYAGYSEWLDALS
jgi:hypothetical protein